MKNDNKYNAWSNVVYSGVKSVYDCSFDSSNRNKIERVKMARELKYPLTKEEILGIKDGSIAYKAMKEKYGFHYTIYRNIRVGSMPAYEALLQDSVNNNDEIDEPEIDESNDEIDEPKLEGKKASNARALEFLKDKKRTSLINGDIYYLPKGDKIVRFIWRKDSGVSLEQALINEGFLK